MIFQRKSLRERDLKLQVQHDRRFGFSVLLSSSNVPGLRLPKKRQIFVTGAEYRFSSLQEASVVFDVPAYEGFVEDLEYDFSPDRRDHYLVLGLSQRKLGAWLYVPRQVTAIFKIVVASPDQAAFFNATPSSLSGLR
ncbi:MAG: hypothetical protein HC794_01395 [Nitrospiraceae bacterium]|nr:hypothetical protein [Nitrospiraceae bacterium]